MYYEDMVNNELIKRGINNSSHLNIRSLSEAFEMDVYYWNCGTMLMIEDKTITCIIDCKSDPVTQYEDFLHELAHLIYTSDYRTITNPIAFQHIERKVDALVPYIAIPKFALGECKGKPIGEISEEFGITQKLVFKRLSKIKNRSLSKEVIPWQRFENAKERML